MSHQYGKFTTRRNEFQSSNFHVTTKRTSRLLSLRALRGFISIGRYPMTYALDARIECLWSVGAELGEGLTYESATNTVWFIDIKTHRLFSLRLNSGVRKTWSLPSQVTALAMPTKNWRPPLDADHLFLCAGQHGFGWLGIRGDHAVISQIAHPESKIAGNRFNDGKLGPDGRFYAGTMDDAEQDARGSFYAIDPDGAVTLLDNGFRVSNGPAFSADGHMLYANDSARQLTYAYDLRSNGLARNRRIFHKFDKTDGFPDGMTSDDENNIWIAMWDGGKIQRLNCSGMKSGFVQTPVQRPTNLISISSSEFVFTSAAVGLPRRTELDGGLFRMTLRRKG